MNRRVKRKYSCDCDGLTSGELGVEEKVTLEGLRESKGA